MSHVEAESDKGKLYRVVARGPNGALVRMMTGEMSLDFAISRYHELLCNEPFAPITNYYYVVEVCP